MKASISTLVIKHWKKTKGQHMDDNTPSNDSDMSLNQLYQKGLKQMKEQFGPDAKKYLDPIKDIAPFFEKINVEYPYGKVYTRTDKLDLRVRSLATIAALTVLGHAESQFDLHIKGALNVGATKQEIIEIITQMSAYCGFPLTTQSFIEAKKVFAVIESN